MEPETKLWLTLANDDFQNTQLLWKNRRYGATVFFSQQAVEKILKAYIVEFRKTLPPKTHRIEILIQAAKLDLSEIDSPAVDALSKAYQVIFTLILPVCGVSSTTVNFKAEEEEETNLG